MDTLTDNNMKLDFWKMSNLSIVSGLTIAKPISWLEVANDDWECDCDCDCDCDCEKKKKKKPKPKRSLVCSL